MKKTEKNVNITFNHLGFILYYITLTNYYITRIHQLFYNTGHIQMTNNYSKIEVKPEEIECINEM